MGLNATDRVGEKVLRADGLLMGFVRNEKKYRITPDFFFKKLLLTTVNASQLGLVTSGLRTVAKILPVRQVCSI